MCSCDLFSRLISLWPFSVSLCTSGQLFPTAPEPSGASPPGRGHSAGWLCHCPMPLWPARGERPSPGLQRLPADTVHTQTRAQDAQSLPPRRVWIHLGFSTHTLGGHWAHLLLATSATPGVTPSLWQTPQIAPPVATTGLSPSDEHPPDGSLKTGFPHPWAG